MRTPNKLIDGLGTQLRINGMIKAFCLSFSAAILLGMFPIPFFIKVLLALSFFTFFVYYFSVAGNKRQLAREILHSRYPSLEFSLELGDKKEKSVAEELQWERVAKNLQPLKVPRVFLDRTGYFFLVLFVSGIIAGSSSYWKHRSLTEGTSTTTSPVPVGKQDSRIPLGIQKSSISITPPAYTKETKQVQSQFAIKALNGSAVTWELVFNIKSDLAVTLVNAGGDEVPFQKKGEAYVLDDRLTASGIYAIRAYDTDSLAFESDFYPLEVYGDKAPIILPEEKETYRYHFVGNQSQYPLKARISDDFMVTEAFLVATLASGSGENVRFREIRMPVDRSNFVEAELTQHLDLAALDFKPGEELYYYWAAFDNRTPQPNFSRSDTYFIQYVDSSGLSESQLAGMAVNVLPEYFRSQRQIIIDTEKLISERKELEEETFNSTSNEIGFDQKLLRMRYGQYLGEEFESDAGGAAGHPEAADNILESFMHLHDQEGKEGEPLSPGAEKATDQSNKNLPPYLEETHDHPESEGNDLGDLLEQYLHNHDDGELNTYFEESTRVLLKMALEQMWQSELHLRLFEPEKALPFQNKALEYLKTVQQKSRVYVQRTGFDPPPIREEEKRLSGELKELEQDIEVLLLDNENIISPLAAKILGMLQQKELTESDRKAVEDFSALWMQRLQYTGIQDWSLLLLLQKMNTASLDPEGKKELSQKLLPLLPTDSSKIAAPLTNKDLEKAFWNNLK